VLAFDFGTQRIGVAVGNTLVRTAHPLTIIPGEANASRFAAIAALIDEWQPELLVVGRPFTEDGGEQETAARSDRFARLLGGRFGVPVARIDERYTSRTAAAALDERGVRGRTVRVDAVAAQIILQAWFDAPASREGSPSSPKAVR